MEVLDPIAIWPGTAPGSEMWTQEETEHADPDQGVVIKNVTIPTITPVLPPPGQRNGTAVVVAPGGAFFALSWDHEGMATAQWLAERGIAAFVLKYRLVPDPDPAEAAVRWAAAPDPSETRAYLDFLRELVADRAEVGTADGEQAVRMIRARSAEWAINPERVGILGYSAGGTVALTTGATVDPEARPAFVAGIYGGFVGRPVGADAPPCFVVVALDDPINQWCLDAADSWRSAGCQVELHLYEQGGHAFALREQGLPIDSWTDRLVDWLGTRRLL